MFSDTFAGIAPSSAPAFIAAQVIGGALAVVVIRALYPGVTPDSAADVVVPRLAGQPGADTHAALAGSVRNAVAADTDGSLGRLGTTRPATAEAP